MPGVDMSYNQLQHSNATTASIYDVVNEFLEAITTQKNKVAPASYQQEKPPWTKKEINYSESCLCKRGARYYYLSGERDVCFH